jgi:hypothetical protein
MIADTATEGGLDFSAELITSVSRSDVARGIPRYGITRAQAAITIVYRLYGEGRFSLAGVGRSLSKASLVPKLSTCDSFTR